MPSQISMVELEEKTRAFMQECGQEPPSVIILDGNIHRYDIPGDKRGSKCGWYLGYFDEHPTVVFCDWKIGIKHTFRPDSNQQPPTQRERDAWAKRDAETGAVTLSNLAPGEYVVRAARGATSKPQTVKVIAGKTTELQLLVW